MPSEDERIRQSLVTPQPDGYSKRVLHPLNGAASPAWTGAHSDGRTTVKVAKVAKIATFFPIPPRLCYA